MTNTVTLSYPNGDRYVGQVSYTIDRRILPNGIGTKYYINGDVYNGSFYFDQFHGQGTYKSINGDMYKGTYHQNLQHGQGETYRASDQRRYIGGYYMGSEEGYATITVVDFAMNGGAKKYIGYMKNGRRHGQGTQWVTGPDGLITAFEGQWYNGLLNGPGTETHPTRCLSGTFVNGKLEGAGTYRDSQGVAYQVIFQGGMIVRYL
jgi:hypothetical protein